MIIGSNAIVMSIDDARKLLDALRLEWNSKTIADLQRRGLFDVVDGLRGIVRAHDRSIS